jgi:uncharacterized protein YecE (DUF72 family)
MRTVVGTCGWIYDHWKKPLYEGVPQHSWLVRYAEQYPTVEIDSAFYRLPGRRTFEHWREQTPDDFVFAVKMSRYLTHVKRLHDPAEPVRRFLDRAEGLGDKLGPVLLQLPPTLHLDVDVLSDALAEFPRETAVAVEFRHTSWFVDEARELLEKFGVALAVVDGGVPSPRWRTTDWGYVRFHGGQASPPSCYGDQALHSAFDELSELYRADDPVYVYFNNDSNGCAIGNANTFTELAGSAW